MGLHNGCAQRMPRRTSPGAAREADALKKPKWCFARHALPTFLAFWARHASGAMSQVPTSAFLSPEEVDQLCGHLTSAAARRRFLTRQGIRFIEDPKGRPVVLREPLQSGASSTARTAAQPNEAGLVAMFASRRPGRRSR